MRFTLPGAKAATVRGTRLRVMSARTGQEPERGQESVAVNPALRFPSAGYGDIQDLMQIAIHPPAEAHRRPGGLDLLAAVLLLATVVLHVVAMAPAYFLSSGTGKSLMDQPDQAALYAVLAGAWALALALGLTGPARTPVSAGFAVGIAAAELGFRVADLGDVFRYGASSAGGGLWLMIVAWVVGAAGAVVAVLAARRRHGNIAVRSRPSAPHEPQPPPEPEESVETGWNIDWAAPAPPGAAATGLPAGNPYGSASNPYAEQPAAPEPRPPAWLPSGSATAASASAPTVSVPVPAEATAPTSAMAVPVAGADVPSLTSSRGGDTGILPVVPEDSHAAQERTAWTMLVVVLALLVAGAFLPSWDHYVGVSTVTGRSISVSLGNAFSGPWQQVIGTVLAALALAVVPIVGVRLHNRAVGAALTCGTLLVLASQLVAAIVQVDRPVSPSLIGLSPSQAAQLGVQLGLKLTGWFTVDAIAAYALFAAIMVWATLRVVHENSPGVRPSAPDWRSDAISWGP
jgi:hypothetical protein